VAEESSGQSGGLLAGLAPGARMAGYRLEERVGAGGMAVVFRARDERLGRVVALKVLTPVLAADEGFRERFIRESRAAAAVDDPHIIPVYAAGEADGVLFIAMRFVAGGDLRSVVSREGPLPPARAAAVISPVASALDAAHGAGLVHRDVKPANVLVDAGPGRPDHVYLSDFGLSKGTLSAAGLTGSGLFLGTPDYSAPEQISGRRVDGRADQYALACVAYTLLTGGPLFERDEPMAVLWAHLSEPPPPVSALRPDLPRAADQVLARALAKVPENRFGSCGEFADALRETLGLAPYNPHRATEQVRAVPHETAVLAGQTVHDVTQTIAPALNGAMEASGSGHAGHVPEPGLVRPASRRRIGVAALAGILLAVAAVVVATLVVPATHGPPAVAGKSTTPARRSSAVTLGATLPDPASQGIVSAAFSSDGGTLAAADGNGSTYVWDIATRSRIATLPDPPSLPSQQQGIVSAAFSSDGGTLAAADGNGNVYVWDIATRSRIATLTGLKFPVALSSHGRTLAASEGYGADLWDVRTGALIATLTDPDDPYMTGAFVTTVALSPDGKILAVSDDGDRTYMWATTTRTVIATLGKGANWTVFSADGKTLASCGLNGKTDLWNVARHTLIATLPGPGDNYVTTAALSPDGTFLAAADHYGQIALWDITTRTVIATVTDPGGEGVSAAVFSPSGKTLAVTDRNGSTYLWDIRITVPGAVRAAGAGEGRR